MSSKAGRDLGPTHKPLSEREMINDELLCKACPDGGKWKHYSEFYVNNCMSRGRHNRCKVCMQAAKEKTTAKRLARKESDPVDTGIVRPDADSLKLVVMNLWANVHITARERSAWNL